MRWPIAVLVFTGCVQQSPPIEATSSIESLRPAAEPTPLAAPAAVASATPVPVDSLPGRVALETGETPKPPPLSANASLTRLPVNASQVSELRQVTAQFELAGAGAPSVAAVEFIAPDGAPYDRREQGLTGTAFDKHSIEQTLPIAGTVIDTSRMTGKWQVRLYVDGKVVNQQSFELSP